MEIGLSLLLQAFWIAGIVPLIVVSIPSPRLHHVRQLLLQVSKRGKILPSTSHKFTVPQRFFLHFYIVAVVWTMILLLTTWLYAYKVTPMVSESSLYSSIASQLTGGGSHLFSSQISRSDPVQHRHNAWQSVFLLLLMEVQVLRRLYETVYVFNYSPSARMHISGYFTGLYFYIAAPLSLCCICAPDVFHFAINVGAEFIVRGKDAMSTPEMDIWGCVDPLLELGWCQWIGAALFLWGWIHQRRCHSILGSLREKKRQADEYVIPYGDWFEIVSSPHYLAEIVILRCAFIYLLFMFCQGLTISTIVVFLLLMKVIYAGFVVASRGADLTIWLLFVFVVANLAVIAGETQRWYAQKFDNYPKNRFSIIPFLY